MGDHRTLVSRLRNPIMTLESTGVSGAGRAVMSEEHARKDMAEAADEIERLLSLAGAASDGPSLADIKIARHGVSG